MHEIKIYSSSQKKLMVVIVVVVETLIKLAKLKVYNKQQEQLSAKQTTRT